jgi:replication initiation protein RepC
MQNLITTPSTGPLSLKMVRNQFHARTIVHGATVNKWHALSDIKEAKEYLGIKDRAITVLSALMSFHPDNTLDAGKNLIVFPANKTLCTRANGISESTMRRHLSTLIDANLIIRKASPNGKRYPRKDRDGTIKEAYGFDLTPLVSRAAEFAYLATRSREEKQEIKEQRDKIHIHQRDIREIFDLVMRECIPGEWKALMDEFEPLSKPLKRIELIENLAALEGLLMGLNAKANNLLKLISFASNMTANDAQNERHIEINKQIIFESEILPAEEDFADTNVELDQIIQFPSSSQSEKPITLETVIAACPKIKEIHPENIKTFEDMINIGHYLQTILGVHLNLIWEAYKIYHPAAVATILAIIYEKGTDIRNPGAYFRTLLKQGLTGQFSINKNIASLLNKREFREKIAKKHTMKSPEEINAFYENMGLPDRVGSFYAEAYAEYVAEQATKVMH